MQAALGGKPLELHSHASLGLSPLTCLVAAELGVHVLQVGCGALGNGTSLPDAEQLVANLRASGHTVDVDDRLLAPSPGTSTGSRRPRGCRRASRGRSTRRSWTTSWRAGSCRRPGGSCAELGMADRFDALMAEIAQVRAELGYPIMVTPFPQMVIGQALANLLSARRGTRATTRCPTR